MNKTLVMVVFFVLIALAIVGTATLMIFRPEAVDGFVSSIVTLLGIGTAAVVTIYGLGQQGKTLDTIKANTNGTLSELRAENRELRRRLEAAETAERGAHAASLRE